MYARSLSLPERSFFLFGPRATGKTTWLKQVLPDATWFDLVRPGVVLELSRDTSTLRSTIEALPDGGWVVVDEIQKLPALLDEIHGIMADHGDRFRFALSGSSARKLKRLHANLLAGRAINRRFFPLTGEEMNFDFHLDDLLRFGCLPTVRDDPEYAVDILEAYAVTYLREEIQQEALVKDLGSFSRFLEVAALMNGQVLNMAAAARDCGVARTTVQRYFETLIDTLVATWVPGWSRKVRVKETSRPKFYVFDPGVVSALGGRLREQLDSAERGPLLETLVLHELRAWMNVSNCGGTISYWRTPSGSEVDFIWARGDRAIGIEVKATPRWRSEFGRPLRTLMESSAIEKGYAIYAGDTRLRSGEIDVMPVKTFMQELIAGRVIG